LVVILPHIRNMNKLQNCCWLLLCFVSIGRGFSQEKAKVLCVGFYNVENYFDTLNDPLTNDDEFTPRGEMNNTSEVFEKKTMHLATVIAQMGRELTPDGPALLGLAEVENVDVLIHLSQHPYISQRNYMPIHFDSKDARGIDVALLYNPAYFIPIHAHNLFVPITNDKGMPSYTRDILWVSGILDGDTTHIFVNHWPSRRGGEKKSSPKREAAARVAKGVIDSLMQVHIHTKVILMGDLNDDPINKSVKKVLNASFDKHKTEAGQLYNPFYSFFKSGDGTLAYRDAWNLFDQILVSEAYINGAPSSTYQLYKASIFKPQMIVEQEGRFKGYPKRSFAGGQFIDGYSDHFPTYIFLKKTINEVVD